MSPKQITRLALIIGGISLIGVILMLAVRPGWSFWSWWPALGLGLAGLLLIVSLLRGAYLTAQRRAEMVDMLNECYYPGLSERETH